MNKKKLVIFCLIVFLGSIIRFRDITTNPPNLNTDEAAIGYNAYSILKTGKDEYGQAFPLAFRSFDDYKPPLYIYLAIPSVAVFGLNEFAVRFPSAFLGVLAIIITYFLAAKLFKSAVVGLAASFLLAVSPWHIQFTRTAYETGSNAFFTSLGLLLFLKGLEKKWFLVFAAIVFGLQTYLYQASKVFVPLLVGGLLFTFSGYLRSNMKRAFMFIIPFAILLLPMIVMATSSSGILRLQGTSIFVDPKAGERHSAYMISDWLRNDNKSVLLFHPDFLTYFQDVLVGYLSHFRPDFFLASRSDPKIAYVPEVGLVQLWVFPFVIAGFYYLFKKQNKTAAAILTLWVLISPVPASVTTGLPSAIRTAVFLPSLQVIAAFGLISLYGMLKKLHPSPFLVIAMANVLIAVYIFAFYNHMLLIHAPISHAKTWYSNYKKFTTDSIAISGKYQKIIVSTKLDEPYIFYLFYSRFDPAAYQASGGTVSGGFKEQGNHIEDKYFFYDINWFKEEKELGNLLVMAPSEVPTEAKKYILAKYNSLDATPLAYFVETR